MRPQGRPKMEYWLFLPPLNMDSLTQALQPENSGGTRQIAPPIHSVRAIRNKHIANAPYGLNVARHGRIDFNQLAQA